MENIIIVKNKDKIKKAFSFAKRLKWDEVSWISIFIWAKRITKCPYITYRHLKYFK